MRAFPDAVRSFLIFCLPALMLILSAYAVSVSLEDVPAKEIAAVSDAGSNQSHGEVEKEKPFLRILFHDPTAFFTMVLAVFTTLLAGTTIQLFHVTQAGIVDQAELTRRSVDASLASSRAHVRLSKVRIGVDEIYQRQPRADRGYAVAFSAEIVNFGNTPADVVRLRVGAMAHNVNLRRGRTAWPESNRLPWLPRTLANGAKAVIERIDIDVAVTGQMINALIRKQLHMFVRLEVFYYDVFGTLQVEDVVWRAVRGRSGSWIAMPHTINRTEPQD